MITRALRMIPGSILCLQLACQGVDLPDLPDEGAATELRDPASEQDWDPRLACSRITVKAGSHPVAQLRLLPDTLSLQDGQTFDLRRDTPPGAATCRLHLSQIALRD